MCNSIHHHHEIGKHTKSEWNNRGPMMYLDDEEFNTIKLEPTIYGRKTIVKEELGKTYKFKFREHKGEGKLF